MSPVQSVSKTECHKYSGTATKLKTAQPGLGELAAPWSQEGQGSQTGSTLPSRGHRSCRKIAAGLLGPGLER